MTKHTTTSALRGLAGEDIFGQAIFVVGLQYGDEGKGKIVDMLTADVSAVARGNGGSNAGHTIVLENGRAIALHQLPSGIAYNGKLNIIGHGMLVDPVRLLEEVKYVRAEGISVSPDNLAISDMAHMVCPKHKVADAGRESGNKAQGSTKAGIAFTASDKSLREGIRVEAIRTKTAAELSEFAKAGLEQISERGGLDIEQMSDEFAEAALQLKSYIRDTPFILNGLLDTGHDVLVEGAQAYGLDINHGKYPYTTSTGTTVAALIEGTGINPKRAGRVVGVVKATPSKVGGGSFVGKIDNETIAASTRGQKGEVDGEYGATTGRQREVGYLDLVLLKRAIQINGVDDIALTKIDCLKRHGSTTKVVVAYERGGEQLLVPPNSDEELAQCKPVYKEFSTWEDDTSKAAETYLTFIEQYLEKPISIVSNGPGRDQVIIRASKS